MHLTTGCPLFRRKSPPSARLNLGVRPHMASAALTELFNAAVEFAEAMLAKEGEFIPFGVTLTGNEKVALVHGSVGVEDPASTDVIDLLQSSFEQSAAEGSISAAGVCLDIKIVPPGAAEKSDAICVRLAHVSGEAVEVYLPYTCEQSGHHAFGEVFATAAATFKL